MSEKLFTMLFKRFCALLLFYSFALISKAQVFDSLNLKQFDYSKVDSIALNFPKGKYKSYTDIVAPLTQGITTEHERLRVIYRWITDNIKYSLTNKSSDPDKAIRLKKAVCGGYAFLFAEMCKSAGLECVVISGNAKGNYDAINKRFKTANHAWNAVKLYGKWYLIDVTWATSFYNLKKRKYIKALNDFYYLTNPEDFVYSHFPADNKWQLLDKPKSKKWFIQNPVYRSAYFKQDVLILSHPKGKIKQSLKKPLEIVFQSSKKIVQVNVNLSLTDKKLMFEPEIVQENGNYIIRQQFEKEGVYRMNVFVNGINIAEYKLILK